ncbi:hypothetical protein DFJ58DRAFT_835801 [Suillus subalutaceus]|uniref:uncharacterized protein n=1 Tax=Suillus subalutaceus TaxID=48586 RepID=UPI001B8714C8|nr:uncharacterized protein DFJ58DRAFT_835801 [Suillus subalutaceus]KAG1876470.1 hypothetical protein DFJ58DRAFT_835801 [Suillus subalutaceus]
MYKRKTVGVCDGAQEVIEMQKNKGERRACGDPILPVRGIRHTGLKHIRESSVNEHTEGHNGCVRSMREGMPRRVQGSEGLARRSKKVCKGKGEVQEVPDMGTWDARCSDFKYGTPPSEMKAEYHGWSNEFTRLHDGDNTWFSSSSFNLASAKPLKVSQAQASPKSNISMQNPNCTENQACTLSHGALLEGATPAIVNLDSRATILRCSSTNQEVVVMAKTPKVWNEQCAGASYVSRRSLTYANLKASFDNINLFSSDRLMSGPKILVCPLNQVATGVAHAISSSSRLDLQMAKSYTNRDYWNKVLSMANQTKPY